MLDGLRPLIVLAGGLLVAWLVVLATLGISQRRQAVGIGPWDAVRLVPDTIRLSRRLAADSCVPRGVRAWLWLLLGYLMLPIDLVPDFIPVLGYCDDVIAVAFVLRKVIRRAGPDALARHWPGTEEGLATVQRLAGLPLKTC